MSPRFSVLVVLALMGSFSAAQYVSLEGRKFMLDGEEFYPRVMNYGLQFATNVDSSNVPGDIFISPEGGYDRDVNGFFECNSFGTCNVQTLAHFEKIASMGFNAIRLVNVLPTAYRDSSGTDHYRLSVYPTLAWHPNYPVDLDVTTFEDSMTLRLFSLIETALDLADSAGLKVILLTGTEVRPLGPGMPGAIEYTEHDAELYADYLGHLATALQGHPALLAYDLMNEPAYRPNRFNSYSKATACEWSTLWYDAIKVEDPNHLVTLGGANLGDLNGWDPGVMKLDFYSPHIYPQPLFIDSYNLSNAQKRYDAELYWLAKACPMPWLIGETGFTADDDTTDLHSHVGWTLLRPEPEYHRMPWMNGNEHEQTVFAKHSMDQVRAFQGSGYSWWGFQNGGIPMESAIAQNNPGIYSINFVAVLKYGDGVNPWFNKEVVDSCLVSYVLPPASDTLPDPPQNYYEWLGSTGDVMYEGHLQDQFANPIPDAIARLLWRYDGLGQDDSYIYEYKPTDAEGDVVFRKPPPVAGFTGPAKSELQVTATGGKVLTFPGFSYPSSVQIDRQAMLFGAQVVDATVPIGAERDYRAWSQIEVSDWTVQGNGGTGGTVDLRARQWIHLASDCHIQHGSEVHIHTEPVFPNCGADMYRGLEVPQDRSNSPMHTLVANSGQIRLQFLDPDPAVQLFPNPCNEFFHISSNRDGVCALLDARGSILETWAVKSGAPVHSVAGLSPGTYFVRFTATDFTQTIPFTKLP